MQGLFFLAVPGELPTSFVQALIAIGYRPVPLSGEGKVVDIAIQRTAEALLDEILALGLTVRREDGGPAHEVLLGIEGKAATFRPLHPQEELP